MIYEVFVEQHGGEIGKFTMEHFREEMFGCKGVLTKAPIYAVERINAIRKIGFLKSEYLLLVKWVMHMMGIGQLNNCKES